MARVRSGCLPQFATQGKLQRSRGEIAKVLVDDRHGSAARASRERPPQGSQEWTGGHERDSTALARGQAVFKHVGQNGGELQMPFALRTDWRHIARAGDDPGSILRSRVCTQLGRPDGGGRGAQHLPQRQRPSCGGAQIEAPTGRSGDQHPFVACGGIRSAWCRNGTERMSGGVVPCMRKGVHESTLASARPRALTPRKRRRAQSGRAV
jgi:hypothetical protein